MSSFHITFCIYSAKQCCQNFNSETCQEAKANRNTSSHQHTERTWWPCYVLPFNVLFLLFSLAVDCKCAIFLWICESAHHTAADVCAPCGRYSRRAGRCVYCWRTNGWLTGWLVVARNKRRQETTMVEEVRGHLATVSSENTVESRFHVYKHTQFARSPASRRLRTLASPSCGKRKHNRYNNVPKYTHHAGSVRRRWRSTRRHRRRIRLDDTQESKQRDWAKSTTGFVLAVLAMMVLVTRPDMCWMLDKFTGWVAF